MKYTWTRQIEFEGKNLSINFEYWPATWDTRLQPGDPAEINLLTITDADGKNVPVPEIKDDGGNGDAEKLHELLLNAITEEEVAMETVAVEPWD